MDLVMKVDQVVFERNEDENYLMLAFGNEKQIESEYLICQRAIIYNQQDIDFGMLGVYLEISGQANSGYNVCPRVQLRSNELIFELTNEFGKEVERVILVLKNGSYEQSSLTEHLKNIWGNKFEEIDV
jgi:hypothetical protein